MDTQNLYSLPRPLIKSEGDSGGHRESWREEGCAHGTLSAHATVHSACWYKIH